jgi:hypothetical protein
MPAPARELIRLPGLLLVCGASAGPWRRPVLEGEALAGDNSEGQLVGSRDEGRVPPSSSGECPLKLG